MGTDIHDLTTEFQSFRAVLKSYILRITANRQDAEDIVQEAFIKAHEKLASFQGGSSLKTWVFAIASNIARDHLRSVKRWPEHVGDIVKDAAMNNPGFLRESLAIRQTSPHGAFEIREHIALCFTCVAKSLPLEQHIAVMLKEVYAFTVKEIAQIIDNTEAMVKYYLQAGRSRMIEVFDHRCALVNKNGVCHQCTELNGIYNPKQNAQEELVKIGMARDAERKDKEHLFDLRMKLVGELDPFNSPACELQLHHLEHNRQVMERHLEKV
ncbi:MAG: sigma-70 family RNA polymerase sigma factor [Flavobacteriales bacterium]